MKLKNIFRKMMVSLVAFVMMAVMIAPITAEAAMTYSKKGVYYLNGKNSSGYTNIYVDGISSSKKILSVSSTDKSVVKATGYSNNSYSNKYVNIENKDYNYSSSERYGYISARLLKPGKATLKFKVGKTKDSAKTYKTEITVKKYENPIKSLKITGINSGNNIYKKFNNGNYSSGSLSKNAEKATIEVKANTDKNWKVKSIEFYNYKNNDSRRISCGGNGKSSISLNAGTIYAAKGGYVYITMYNTKYDAYMYCYYHIAAK